MTRTDMPPRHRALDRLVASAKTYGALVGVLIAVVVFFSIASDQYATFGNVTSVLSTSSPLLIVALALTFTMIAGGFDLSLAGIVVFSGILVSKLFSFGLPIGVAILVTIALMTLFGAVLNGIAIARFELNFFVVTLATMSISGGLALVIADGQTLTMSSPFMLTLGQGDLFGVPFPILVAAVVFVIAVLLMRYTGFGRMIYAVGGNSEAAHLAGIPVVTVRIGTYAVGAGLGAVAGVLQTATLVSASSAANPSILLTAAAAVFIGGTSFSGGKGTMLGTLLGVIFLAALQNGLLVSAVPVYWQGVITGAILLVSIGLDRFRTRPRRRIDARRLTPDAPPAPTAPAGDGG